ncbi:putative zinc finger protein [Operophtera brumata]|uniref:Putative zinc finger protein n=1 Tax=Operophtera brumata TaxID=104452 RepID=A0A0L7LP16_OPEBR|nr:putative zinc finger protein [Operophtera brumata]
MKLSVSAKLGADDIGDYKQALDVMTECARILHVRWLQGQLLKELLEVVVKFKHRQWNMILPEHKNKKSCGLWLTCGRTLEIWKILKTTKRKVFEERRVLKHVLCLVSFYSRRSVSGFKRHLTSEEKDDIESNDERFNVCFECSLPFEELKDQIKCSRCKLLSFCSLECMKANINRAGCHPCSEFLMNKYFSSPEKSVESVVT